MTATIETVVEEQVADRVDREIHELRQAGIDVRRVHVADPGALSDTEQSAADALIAGWTERTLSALASGARNPQLLLDDDEAPGFPHWMAVRKLAVALHPLHAAGEGHRTFGCGLTAGRVRAAYERLTPTWAAADSAAFTHYERMFATPWQWRTRAIMQGSQDGKAIRTRGVAVGELVEDWLSCRGRGRVASIGSGAAFPMAQLARRCDAVAELSILDRDLLALATASEAVDLHGPGTRVHLHPAEVFALAERRCADLTPVLGRGSQDVVEMVGLFEYVPSFLAADLLRRAADVTREGGVLVLANMLRHRPQHDFFSHVVQWPRLAQRSLSELVGLVVSAGLRADRIRIVLPDPGIYAVVLVER